MTPSCTAVALAMLLVAGLAAQQPPPPPTFSTRIEAVLVDVVVRDKSGQAVPGLTVSDFVVKEDGKERPILSFAAFDESSALPASAPEQRAARARPHQVSTVVLIDDGNLTQMQMAAIRPALRSILEKFDTRSGAMSLVA